LAFVIRIRTNLPFNHFHISGETSVMHACIYFAFINPLNTELNPICHLLALLGAHHILYISRIRVKPALNAPPFTHQVTAEAALPEDGADERRIAS
jgi:hypothetical protein